MAGMSDEINSLPALKSAAEVVKTDNKSKTAVGKIAKAMAKVGVIGISKGTLQSFQDIGVNINPQAFIGNGRAGALIGQQVAAKVLVDVQRIFESASDKGKLRIIPHIACMVRALSTANKNIKELSEEEPKGSPKQSVNVTVHTMVPMNALDIPAEKPVLDVAPADGS